ncbi:glycosyltransferase [Microbacterium caowuchunii]|uniref:glycosyltransferase n=1 Tax=Microbacterium caowuchunii TaxID=2614638 RepID=UPI001781D50D|nr:glycosyltransferase [Microbacterium caowuchunii]
MNEVSLHLSVVLPSYRRLGRLPALIAAYTEQGADEVLIVLDGPHPGWEAALGALPPRARVMELPQNVGLALARIAGLRAITGDVVLTVDDDVEPGPGLVDRHRRFHATLTDRVLLGYMPVALPSRRGADDAATYLYARDYEAQARVWRSSDSDTILGSLWGGNVSLPRVLYERAEASRPSARLDYNEDLDLGLRLRDLGATAHFDEAARATHHHARDLSGFLAESETRGAAVAELERRWGSRPPQLTPLVEVPSDYSRLLAAAARRISERDGGGLLLGLCTGAYRAAGACRAWRAQDAAARFLRRALAMRGYRKAGARS